MRRLLKDGGHLLRVAALFAAGTFAFFILRGILVPEDFGRYGHYRAGALVDATERKPTFAGKAACLDCHGDVPKEQQGSKHAKLSCEACHGPLARHAEDPEKAKPEKKGATSLCLACHRVNVARPAKFPQVDPKDHSGGAACDSCHKPHHPEMEDSK
jgi:hypothetical protein